MKFFKLFSLCCRYFVISFNCHSNISGWMKKQVKYSIRKDALKPHNSLIACSSEGSTWSRLKTFPLLMCQIWPQFRVARILYFYRKDDNRWIEEKEHHEKELSSLGKYIFFFILNKKWLLKGMCYSHFGNGVLNGGYFRYIIEPIGQQT